MSERQWSTLCGMKELFGDKEFNDKTYRVGVKHSKSEYQLRIYNINEYEAVAEGSGVLSCLIDFTEGADFEIQGRYPEGIAAEDLNIEVSIQEECPHCDVCDHMISDCTCHDGDQK